MLKIIATESDDTAWTISNKHLMSLVKMYVEEEREMCAKVCDNSMEWHKNRLNTLQAQIAATCASSIRARDKE
jgi:acyl CoA:acetate/3-ketoacid CoA transferase alpha subunit